LSPSFIHSVVNILGSGLWTLPPMPAAINDEGYHITKLSETVSHKFSLIWDAAIFGPEDRDGMPIRNVDI